MGTQVKATVTYTYWLEDDLPKDTSVPFTDVDGNDWESFNTYAWHTMSEATSRRTPIRSITTSPSNQMT